MTTNFEGTLISVWRQALLEDRKTVTLEGIQCERYLNHILSVSADCGKLGA